MAGEAAARRVRRSGWRGAAALALLLPLAGCTAGDGGGPGGATTTGQGSASSTSPTIGADGRTSPSAVWSSGPKVRPRPGGAGEAVLLGVRTGRQDGFERIVFDFEGGFPGHRAAYVDEVADADGPVRLEGEAILLITFEGARAREAGGGRSFTQEKPRPRYPTVKQVQLVDEGGGKVSFAIGLDGVVGYKVHELPTPDRVIVDLAA